MCRLRYLTLVDLPTTSLLVPQPLFQDRLHPRDRPREQTSPKNLASGSECRRLLWDRGAVHRHRQVEAPYLRLHRHETRQA